jgi:hypothetical protein
MASESVASVLGATAVGLSSGHRHVGERGRGRGIHDALRVAEAAIGIMLVYAPVAVMVTLTVIVRLPPAGMLAPARVNPSRRSRAHGTAAVLRWARPC